MSNGNPPLPAPKVTLLFAAFGVCLAFGCAQEPPAASSAVPAPAPTAPPTGKRTGAAPSAQVPSATTALASSVKFEPVLPEELQKFIASQRGKVVLVDFWATYCVPCREKFPRTLELAKKYGDQGLTTVSMSMDSPDPSYQKQILEFLKKQNSQIKNFANRLEDTDAAFAALDIVGGALPHYKIYSRDGKVRNKFGGDPDHPFDEADIERELAAALKER
jgi:thiol-disulfide isomerase/thioredoxin